MFQSLIASFMDVVLPRDELVKKLEGMSPNQLRKAVSKNIENTLHASSLFSYKDPLVKKAIWEIKYRNNKKIKRLMAEILLDELIYDISEKGQFENFISPILIPIPLSRKRLRERGYNQIENIALEMKKIDKSNSFELRTDILFKIRDTRPQSSFRDKESRLDNLKGCFEVKNPEKIIGRNIILLDDVLTTGQTMKEAAGALTGARKIFSITIAH